MAITKFCIIPAPYTAYDYKVQASTAVGPGEFSEGRQFETLQSGK